MLYEVITDFTDQDVYGNVLIAVTEAVNNAIQHGNLSDPAKQVNITVETSEDQINFAVSRNNFV